MVTYRHCCGSGSAWICIHLAVPDPDPYWKCWSGSGSMETDKNLQINLVSYLSKRLLCLSYVCCFLTSVYNFEYIFHVKSQLFATFKSNQDWKIDPQWFGSLDPVPDQHWDKTLDPNLHWNQCGSTTLATAGNEDLNHLLSRVFVL